MTVDPKAGEKLRNSIDSLSRSYAEVGSSRADAIISTFLVDEVSVEIVSGIIGDAVFRFLFACALKIRSETTPSTFDESIERFILQKTRLTGDLAKRLRQNLKQAVLASEEKRPKKERKDRLKTKLKNKTCYLCSAPITDETVLDHVWPRSAGGGTGKSNLMTAHPFCEAIKADLAVFGDATIGRFAFSNLPRALAGTQIHWWPSQLDNGEQFQTFLDDVRGSQLKIAILMRQGFQCHKCQKSFSDSQQQFLIRRETSEPWWFGNVIALCDDCGNVK